MTPTFSPRSTRQRLLLPGKGIRRFSLTLEVIVFRYPKYTVYVSHCLRTTSSSLKISLSRYAPFTSDTKKYVVIPRAPTSQTVSFVEVISSDERVVVGGGGGNGSGFHQETRTLHGFAFDRRRSVRQRTDWKKGKREGHVWIWWRIEEGNHDHTAELQETMTVMSNDDIRCWVLTIVDRIRERREENTETWAQDTMARPLRRHWGYAAASASWYLPLSRSLVLSFSRYNHLSLALRLYNTLPPSLRTAHPLLVARVLSFSLSLVSRFSPHGWWILRMLLV